MKHHPSHKIVRRPCPFCGDLCPLKAQRCQKCGERLKALEVISDMESKSISGINPQKKNTWFL